MTKSKSEDSSSKDESDEIQHETSGPDGESTTVPEATAATNNASEAISEKCVNGSQPPATERASQAAVVAVAVSSEGSSATSGNSGVENKMAMEALEHEGANRVAAITQAEARRGISAGNTTSPGAVAMAGIDAPKDDFDEENQSSVSGNASTVASDGQNGTHSARKSEIAARAPEASYAHEADDPETGEVEDNSISSPMLEAQLVMPPVEAVQVCIDEDYTVTSAAPRQASLEMEQARRQHDDDIKHKYGPLFWVLLGLVVAVAACAIAIPVALVVNNKRSQTLDCYTSTLDILLAQLSDKPTPQAYILCPNTKIKIGTFNNPLINDFRVVDGDYSILAVRNNVTIQCGKDGRKENNCVIDGGFVQVLTLQKVSTPHGLVDYNGTVDNLTIRGLTFTGSLKNMGHFGGASVSLSHPGRNIRFEDCLWTGMSAQIGFVGTYRNYVQSLASVPLDAQSVDVTFSDCIIQHSVYGGPVIEVEDQNVTMEHCIFRDIQPSIGVQNGCSVQHKGGGCPYFFLCGLGSSCTMNHVCLENFDHYGPGFIGTYSIDAVRYNNIFEDSPLPPRECELALMPQENGTASVLNSCSNILEQASCPFQLNASS